MSDETSRPRRAWQPDDDLQEPLVPEDTAADGAPSPRRGAGAPEDPVNPFARPGSTEAEQPIPAEPMIPAPVFPRSAGEFSDSPSPAPRRSALSSDTPVESGAGSAQEPTSWVAANRRTLATWAAVGVVGALIVGLISFFVARSTGTTEPVTDPTGPPSPSQSASPSPTESAEPAEMTDLVTADDLVPIAPASEWSVITTTYSQAEHDMRAVCLSTTQPAQNSTHSFQRTLGTTGADKLAALHRIDVYATPKAAEEVWTERVAALSSCTELPARIERASSIDGMAEETFQVTFLQEETPVKYHTVLMTRDGAAVQLFDVARDEEPVEPAASALALLRPQARLAEAQDVPAPTTPVATPAVVPPAEPPGWLVPIDLPRLHAGTGRWTMTGPHPVDGTNMGCEDMELATEPGPVERQRTAYALTRDAAVPERFGIDELLFTFDTVEEAAVFVTKLGANLNSCKDRVNTAEVTEHDPVPARDAEGNALSSRVFTATQAISDTEKLTYQLIVSVAGNKVAYTIISAAPEAQFTPEQLTELAARISIRASQLPA